MVSRCITVYASVTSGNVVSSGTVHFAVSVPSPLLLHEVVVESVVPSLTEVYEGDPVDIAVVVQNNGNCTETFNVTIYVNNAMIQT